MTASDHQEIVGEGSGRPLVTIGVPVRNGGEHLGEALESALGQDYPALEVIVCDNASEDNTAAIASHFAGTDHRVRFTRNSSNIGLLPNFRRVRDLARGEYFTWLGHDDLLSSPAYVSTVVDYMQSNPDVGLCHTSMQLLKDREASVIDFPELAPQRRWSDARRDLFRWPGDWLEMASHGVFRRKDLAGIPIEERTRTGRPHVFCWEIDLLTSLACRARIVALPEPLRTYRSSAGSAARRIGRQVSPFDLLLLDLETKTMLTVRALRVPAGAAERMRLAATALANFRRSTFLRRFDHRVALRLVERELALLLRASHERSRLLERLETETQARQDILGLRGEDLARLRLRHPKSLLAAPPATVEAAELLAQTPQRGPIENLFRPPSEAQIDHYRRAEEAAGRLLRHCQAQLEAILEAESVAASLLARIEEGSRS